jgi:hypothetical protein
MWPGRFPGTGEPKSSPSAHSYLFDAGVFALDFAGNAGVLLTTDPGLKEAAKSRGVLFGTWAVKPSALSQSLAGKWGPGWGKAPSPFLTSPPAATRPSQAVEEVPRGPIYYPNPGPPGRPVLNRKRQRRRFGGLVFFVPTVLAVAVVAFAIVSFLSVQNGTLVVEASSSGRYSPPVPLHPHVTVDGTTEVSPFNVTLPQGTYTVTFGEVAWYATPPPRTVVVSGGKSQFAVGVYSPILREIAITSSGFNSTAVTALHGVTPVVWVNLSHDSVVLDIKNLNVITIGPGGNFTKIFPTEGSFDFSLLDTGFNGTVESV